MPKVNPKRLKRIQQVAAQRQSGLVVVLQDIHDPHNAAAVFRTCDAFGVQLVYLIFEQEKYFNPKKIGASSSASANKWLDFKIFRSTKECLAKLRQEGYRLIASVPDPSAKSLFGAKIPLSKIAVLFGNEHHGLSQEALLASDEEVRIPMSGMVQSPNLSVTAGIFLYEASRGRARHLHRFRLSPKARVRLTESFSRR